MSEQQRFKAVFFLALLIFALNAATLVAVVLAFLDRAVVFAAVENMQQRVVALEAAQERLSQSRPSSAGPMQ